MLGTALELRPVAGRLSGEPWIDDDTDGAGEGSTALSTCKGSRLELIAAMAGLRVCICEVARRWEAGWSGVVCRIAVR